MVEEIKKRVYELMKQVDGLYAVIISDRDGVPLVKACIEDLCPPNSQQPTFVSLFGIASEQASKFGLSKTKFMINKYRHLQLVALNKSPLIVTFIASENANVGMILNLGTQLEETIMEMKAAVNIN